MRQTGPADQRGFVLIAVLWLLLLSAALVAMLMLQARSLSQQVSADGADLQRTLNLDAVVQTVAAELIISGPRSRWWLMPAKGEIEIARGRYQVAVSDEANRLDVNNGDLEFLVSALQQLGISPAAREDLAAHLKALRVGNQRVEDGAGLTYLLRQSGIDYAKVCLLRELTLSSGLDRPRGGRSNAVTVRDSENDPATPSAFPRPEDSFRVSVGIAGMQFGSIIIRNSRGMSPNLALFRIQSENCAMVSGASQ